MRVFLILLLIVGGVICAFLVATAGLILMAVSAFGVSAINKLATIRDLLIRSSGLNDGPNPYAKLPTYHDPNAKRGS